MSLKDLEAGVGHAVTATGSLVAMRDAIRMASHAHHYLVLFDNDERPLQLRRSKRIASADQRIVLIAADRGCSFPGCTRPATWSQVHHINEWAAGGNTDIEDLTFGCDQHHRLVGSGVHGWATTKAGPGHRYPGRTLWHAPAVIDPSRRGRVNHFHHPNEYIYPAPEVPLPDMPAPEPASNSPQALQNDSVDSVDEDALADDSAGTDAGTAEMPGGSGSAPEPGSGGKPAGPPAA
jgi:hypothetical protein